MQRLLTRPLGVGIAAVIFGVSFAAFSSLTRTIPAEESPVSAAAPQAADDGKLIVHEWGTFTSFAGSDGVKLEFRPLLDNDLPPFVLNRPRQEGLLAPLSVLLKRSIPSIQRMETPVTYFYTDREREVNVKVRFPNGLLTEFFPPVQRLLPEIQSHEGWSATAQQLQTGIENDAVRRPEPKNSELDWGTITLIPTDLLRPELKNKVAADGIRERMARRLSPGGEVHNDYYFARQTDSAIVHVHRPVDEQHPLKPRGDYFEKFLFYRGIGNFDLPLTLVAEGEDRFTLRNRGARVISSLLLFDWDAKQGHLRFAMYPQIGPGEHLELHLPADPGALDDMQQQLTARLVEAGLYEKEAVAMLNTWRNSWFGEEGTRLFYILPQRQTDAILPLEIQPVPDEIVRVMVGRLEIMTPERERLIEEALEQDPSGESEATTDQLPELPEGLRSLGRFAEPALLRVAATTDAPQVRDEAKRLAKQLKAAAETEE